MSKHYENFLDFHRKNPHVYRTLVMMAKNYRARHRATRLGIATLWENLRWDYLMSTEHADYKLNNNHKAYYARMIMDQEPDLDGLFDLRAQKECA